MIFLMIVPSIMIVTIILIHETTKISYISLASCAAISFLVDAVAAAISNTPNLDYFLKLTAIIFVAAAVVTAINLHLEVKK